MAPFAIRLVDLPPRLRKNIDRRRPQGRRFVDLTDRKFGLRRVIGFVGFRGRFAAWLCECECGALSVVEGAELGRGNRQSCGCSLRLSPAAKKVGAILDAIKSQCYCTTDQDYPNYGGKGIKVCRRWRESKEAFAEDMGPRPSPKHVLVRRNKQGDFSPDNCYWGTRADAIRSRKRGSLREITYGGRTMNLSEWAVELGISREAMRQRVDRCLELEMDISLAISHPIRSWLPRNSNL